MYKKGQSYNCLIGRDASRALATMSLKPEDCISDLTGITDEEKKVLDDWYNHMKVKKGYPAVGIVPGLAEPTV